MTSNFQMIEDFVSPHLNEEVKMWLHLSFIFVAVYVIVASLGEMKTLEETVNNAFSKVIGLFKYI